MGCHPSQLTNSYFSEGFKPPTIELDGKIYRKALYLMVKTMVSCRFSLKPTQWTNQPIHSPGFCWNFLESLHVRGQRRRGRRGPLNRTVPKHWWLRPARWGSCFFFQHQCIISHSHICRYICRYIIYIVIIIINDTIWLLSRIISHRIHGAGIYANIKGVYWWDPCYHIQYTIHGSYGIWYGQ